MNYLNWTFFLNNFLVWLMILVIVICYFKIKKEIKRFSEITTKKEISGIEVANGILEKRGKGDIYVVETRDWYGSHYDPFRKSLRLSKEVFNGVNIASLGQAATEAYVCSLEKDNLFWEIQRSVLPYYRYGILGMYLFLLFGFVSRDNRFLGIGIGLLGMVFIFSIITWLMLRRKKEEIIDLLEETNLIDSLEKEIVNNFLETYILVSIANILGYGVDFLNYWFNKLFDR